MTAAANFPMQGRLLNPTSADYRTEASLLWGEATKVYGSRRRGRLQAALPLRELAERYSGIARRLSWTPNALQQMKNREAA